MKRVVFLALGLACGLSAGCPPRVKPPGVVSCRESDAPKDCKPMSGLGGHQGGYLEGDGLERLHFTLPAGVFPPPPGTQLAAEQTCGGKSALFVSVLAPGCVPVPEADGPGAFACQVDVIAPPPGAATLVPPLTKLCVRQIGDLIADPDPTHHRGVTMVRGFWDGTGAWHDEPNTVTLSCDAASNQPAVEQFVEADGAITKCMRQFRINPQAFSDAFLACIRMTRADYCGDGHPHTYAGTEVSVATPLNPMTTAECTDGRCFEASWSKNGAVCIARPRWTGKGMDFASCRDQFTPSGDLLCRGDPAQGVVFSRSAQYVCKQPRPTACTADLDPVCAAK
jgi:hypothetical protein